MFVSGFLLSRLDCRFGSDIVAFLRRSIGVDEDCLLKVRGSGLLVSRGS